MHAEHVTFQSELLFVVRTPAAGRAIQARSREISDRLNAVVRAWRTGDAVPRVMTASVAEVAVVLLDAQDGNGVQVLSVVYPEDAAVAIERGDRPDSVPEIAEHWRAVIEAALQRAVGGASES